MYFKIALGLTITCLAFAEDPVQKPEILKRALAGLYYTSNSLNPELEAEIFAMVKEDQAARKISDFNTLSEEEKANLSKIQVKHSFRLKEIILTYGWPGIRLVGLEGSKGFWVLVQHQDQDLMFQKQCLTLLKEAVDKQDAEMQNYALLFDRVRKNEKLPQLYGTQFDFRDGKCYLHPVEDSENLEQRRLEAGLMPFESYLKIMKKMYRLSDDDVIIEELPR
ncbi:MAG TPA: DUF6624 domain-containing protein [Rhabdochlamydiaceae bacterium]|jgi:hypothetical protein|nr:DUF6624 domain-containing protein [Rhabdochlamydiaceae bacterium]